jgi:hypothetical protein
VERSFTSDCLHQHRANVLRCGNHQPRVEFIDAGLVSRSAIPSPTAGRCKRGDDRLPAALPWQNNAAWSSLCPGPAEETPQYARADAVSTNACIGPLEKGQLRFRIARGQMPTAYIPCPGLERFLSCRCLLMAPAALLSAAVMVPGVE